MSEYPVFKVLRTIFNGQVFKPGGEVPVATPATETAPGQPGILALAADNDTTSRDKAATPAGVAAQVAAQVAAHGINPILHVQDEKPSGTAGGTFTSGAWRTRDLNTVKTNTIPGASLASNQITLPAGTYDVSASAQAFQVGGHRTRLVTTGGTVLVMGDNSSCHGNWGHDAHSFVKGRFTLATTTIIRLEHITTISGGVYGFGVPCNFGDNEVFAVVVIWRVG